MAEENVSQVKEMIPDEHCCFDDDAKPAEIFQETSVLMVEEIQGGDDVLPTAAVSNGNVNPRRHSTGALDNKRGKAQAQTRYRGNQTSSTHDLCKHGKRREEDLVIKPWKLVSKKDVAAASAAATSEVVKSCATKRCETKSSISITQSDSPSSAGVRMVKKTNVDVKKVPRISENKSDLVKSSLKKTEIDVLEKKVSRISENKKSSKEDLVKKSLKKKEIDDVPEKTLYVVESSIEEKKTEKKKIIKSVKSEIQQSSVKKISRGSGQRSLTLSPSSEEVKEPKPIRQITTRSKTGVSATLVTNSKTESKIRPKRIGLKATPPLPSPPTRPVSFRKGKVVEPKPDDSTPTSIKFKKRVVQEPKLRSDGNNKKKKNLKDVVGKMSYNNSGEGKREKVVLRHRKVEAKKKLQTLFNNVIEETVSKLEEVRKSKVKALVGAFETVISLQDNDVTSQKKKVQSKSASSQVVEG